MAVAAEMIKGARILILEDDPLLAMDLEDFLMSVSVDVVGPVSSVNQALQAVERGIDGAVLDLNLRGTYSYPVIERLKLLGIPFLVCSGYAELPDTREHLQGVALLPKPFDFNRLTAMLAEEFVRSATMSVGYPAARTS